MDIIPTQQTQEELGRLLLLKCNVSLDIIYLPAAEIAERIGEVPEPYHQYLIDYLTGLRTLQSIGQEMNLTRERVRQILFRIMRLITRSFIKGGENSMDVMKAWLSKRIEASQNTEA